MLNRRTLLAAAMVAATFTGPALAQQKLTEVKVAASNRGFWDSTIILFGVDKGWFKEEGLNIDLIWNDGGSDTLQAVASGSVHIGFGNGFLGVLGAWAKGAPVEVIANQGTGAPDLLWYVRKDSPVKTLKDIEGKTVAFTRPGASSQFVLQKIIAAAGVNAKAVSAGGVPAGITAVMSGQIDVGFTVMPIGVDLLHKGDIRIVFTGQEAPGVKDQTVRVHYANANWLKSNEETARKFLSALRKTIDWAYSTDEALQVWANMHKITLDQARQARDTSYPKEMMNFYPMKGLDLTVEEAIASKRLDKPLSADDQKRLLHWQERLNKSGS
jgi:NitT/TauT family transport system substrate-binding protein